MDKETNKFYEKVMGWNDHLEKVVIFLKKTIGIYSDMVLQRDRVIGELYKYARHDTTCDTLSHASMQGIYRDDWKSYPCSCGFEYAQQLMAKIAKSAPHLTMTEPQKVNPRGTKNVRKTRRNG